MIEDMIKPLRKIDDTEIIPPIPTSRRGQVPTIHLATLSDVRAEMSSTFNAAKRGEIDDTVLTRRVWALRQIAQTIADAARLGINATKDDDRPVFTGLTIIAPPQSGATDAK